MPVYNVHDNGWSPFRVSVRGKNVRVEKATCVYKKVGKKYVDAGAIHEEALDLVAERVFIGKESPGGGYDGLEPEAGEGNTILLKLSETEYMFIGPDLYTFSPRPGDTIVRYFSDIGNSDVPYPYAVGKTHIYLLLDRVAVPKEFFGRYQDIYSRYFGHSGGKGAEAAGATARIKNKTIFERTRF